MFPETVYQTRINRLGRTRTWQQLQLPPNNHNRRDIEQEPDIMTPPPDFEFDRAWQRSTNTTIPNQHTKVRIAAIHDMENGRTAKDHGKPGARVEATDSKPLNPKADR